MKCIALIALIATPALAANKSHAEATEAASPPSQQDVTAKTERKTCRTFANTVSRLKTERLCYTREEWKKFDETQQ